MEDKVVRIDSCKDRMRWYSDKIGEFFPVRQEGETETYVSTLDSYNTGNYVQNTEVSFFNGVSE